MQSKEIILGYVNDALDATFSVYSWDDLIDDLYYLSEEEKQWARENIGYQAYIVPTPRKKESV